MTLDADQPSNSRRLADFTAGLAREGLPEEVVHAAKRALVDWLAAVLAGCREVAAGKVRGVVRSIGSEPVATAIGTDLMTSAPFAALANGYASHLQDYDDVFNPPQTTIHLGSCVWPVVMALGESRRVSGREALTSYLSGFEAGARVGIAAGVTHFESSWQVSGTAGHLASAAAAARTLRLPSAQTVNALGLAAAQAAGIREVYGTDTKAMQPGKAAMDGILCALFAEAGMTSSDTALEGKRGLLSAIASAPDPDRLVAGLGSQWHVLYNGHKLYPSASLNHPAVDAAIELHRAATFDIEDIEAIEVRMLPFAASVTDVIHPSPGAGAKFSTAHCVAVALTTGQLGLDDFGANRVDQPAITRLRDRTKVLGDPAIGKRAVSLTIQLRGERELLQDIENNRGTPENPLTDQELEAKLYEVASGRYPESAIAKVINCCWDLDFLDDVTEVLTPLRIALEGVA